MTDDKLFYETARGWWTIGETVLHARYAFGATTVEREQHLMHPLEYACSIHAMHDSTVREFRRAA